MSSSSSVTSFNDPNSWERTTREAFQGSNPHLFDIKSRKSIVISLPPFIEDLVKEIPSPLNSKQIEQLRIYNKQIEGLKFLKLTVLATFVAGIFQAILCYGVDSSSFGGACSNGFFTIVTGLGFLLLARRQASVEQAGIRLKDLIFDELFEKYERAATNLLEVYVEGTPLKGLPYSPADLALLGYSDHRSAQLTFKAQSAQFTNKAKQLSENLPKIKASIQRDADFTETQIKKLLKPLFSAVAIIEAGPGPKKEIDYLIGMQYENMRLKKTIKLNEKIRIAKLASSSSGTSFIWDVD